MVLIEEVKDGGYGRADEIFILPERLSQQRIAGPLPAEHAVRRQSHIRNASCPCRTRFRKRYLVTLTIAAG
jgi:hypothetical protein